MRTHRRVITQCASVVLGCALSLGTASAQDAGDGGSEAPESAGARAETAPQAASRRPDDRVVCERPRSSLAARLPRYTNGLRRMKCHTFFAPSTFDDAFMTTHFGATTAAALLFLPGAQASDGSTYDLLLVGAALSARVGVQLFKWAMIYGEGTGQVVLGSNLESALDVGAQGQGSWDVGGAVKLFRVKRSGTQMSVRGKFVGNSGITIRPSTLTEIFSQRAAEGRAPTQADLDVALTSFSEVGGGGSVNLAQAFASWISLQASVEVTGGKTTSEQVSTDANGDFVKQPLETSFLTLEPGVALTLDGWPSFPVAFQAEYAPMWRRDTTDSDAFEQTQHEVWGGIFYSGHPDIVLGLRAGGVVASTLELPVLQVAAGLELQVYL